MGFGKVVFLLPIFLFTFGFHGAESANILVFGPLGTHSIRISMTPFMEALIDKGHSVTYLSGFDNFDEHEKKSKINFYTPKKWRDSVGDWEDHMNFFDIRKNGLNPQIWWDLSDYGVLACQVLYDDPEFVTWVKTSKFDVVILECAFNECGLGLAHLFKAKLVIYGTMTMLPWFPDAYGFPDETSSLPDAIMGYPEGDKMTFLERIHNAIRPIMYTFKREYSFLPTLEEITRNGLGLGPGELPSFREIEKNASLVFLTSHFTIDFARSLPQHVVPIGGAVLGNKNPKPLPDDMKKFIDSAKNGFIYVSFGTVSEFTNFGKEVQQEFISALGSFADIKFLWKAGKPINFSMPDNVKLFKWVPQQTLLAHPNLKAFITHCGMGSTAEATYFGVPLVILPVLAEQDSNANAIEAKGVGIKLELTTLKKHELEGAIKEILGNKMYRENMKRLSAAFKDRPMQPVETGVWWIEYILRHPNSNDYLVPLSVRQPWWKRRQIDVWLTLGGGIFAALGISLLAIYRTLRFIFKGRSTKGKAKKVKTN